MQPNDARELAQAYGIGAATPTLSLWPELYPLALSLPLTSFAGPPNFWQCPGASSRRSPHRGRRAGSPLQKIDHLHAIEIKHLCADEPPFAQAILTEHWSIKAVSGSGDASLLPQGDHFVMVVGELLTAERPLATMAAVSKNLEGRCPRAVSAIGSLCVVLAVGCGGGHLHAGPVVAYSEARGPTLGWEAGAGGFGLVRLNAGGSYRIEPTPVRKRPEEPEGAPGSREETDDSAYVPPEYVHYLAFEPLGLSIGVDVSELGDVGLMGGFWAGWIVDPNAGGAFDGASNPNRFLPDLDCPNYDPEPALLLSGAIGLRHLGGAWEVYATPKAVVFYCFEYAN